MDEKIKVGFCLTGSFCTFDRVLEQMQVLCAKQYDILPVMSYHASSLDTRFGTAHHFKEIIKAITGKAVIDTIQGAEPIGPKKMTDVLLIAPCTGNTLGKLAHGIFDTPVLMAGKIPSAQCTAFGAGGFHQRCAGAFFQKHWHFDEYETCVFCAYEAGRPG